MAIPLYCPGCGEVVGVDNSLFIGFHPGSSIAQIACPGKGNHQSGVRTITRMSLGLVKRVTIKYPETLTKHSWNEYIGPKRRFYVWLAIMLTENGIMIHGKWCGWSSKLGFFGEGAKEFQSR